MNRTRERRPWGGAGAHKNDLDDVPPEGTTEEMLDRAAELVAVSVLMLDRGQVAWLVGQVGGNARLVGTLAQTKQCWADVTCSALRVLDEYPDLEWAAQRVGNLDGLALVAHLADMPDLRHLAFLRGDWEPIVATLAAMVDHIDVATRRRALAPAAWHVAERLDAGDLPDAEQWRTLADGIAAEGVAA